MFDFDPPLTPGEIAMLILILGIYIGSLFVK